MPPRKAISKNKRPITKRKSHRQIDIEVCKNKVKFKTMQDAIADIMKIQPYQCSVCKCWHIGHNRLQPRM